MEKRGVQQSHLRQPCVVGVKQSKKRGITALALRGAPLSSSVPQRACKKANGGRFRESLIQVHSDVQCWGLAIFFPSNLRPVYPNGFASRRMGLTLTGKYILLFLAVQIAYLLQAVRAAGKCETVFKGFSNCLLELGENMANYPQELDEKQNIQTICGYWDGFHSCATTALADCQEGATDLWEKLKKQSRNLEYPGSLFELCGGGNGASAVPVPFGLALLLTAFSTLVTWFAF